ncbi:MAG: SDR family NAD(P)-dependent oxidoreductase [Armatimonadetes bacterium]|nr:MAG: SDR family NAD(P)-dependent oxidoreductase [Armatimonadota bacterium]
MSGTDAFLDRTLLGFTKLGVSARGLDMHERFPEVAGKHVLVTGATGGIGRAAVRRLASNGATVHAVGRSPDKLAALETDADGTVQTYCADLSNMEAIRNLTTGFVADGNRLDGIVNNVGVMSPERIVTPEGFEISYAVNLLGQYVLTTNLIPSLTAGESRVVLVSSGGMYTEPLTAANIQSTHGEYRATKAYARTKRGQVALASHWARGLATIGVRVNSMHPGWVDTDGVRDSLPTFRRITRPLLRNADQGADTIVWLIASDEATELTGHFIHDRIPRRVHRTKRTVAEASTVDQFITTLKKDAAPYVVSPTKKPKDGPSATD